MDPKTTIDELVKHRISGLAARRTHARAVTRLKTLVGQDEQVIELATCVKAWKNGLLAITDRRLIFVNTNGDPEQVAHAELGPAEVGQLGTGLIVEVAGGRITFGALPKGRAAEVAGRLPGLRESASTHSMTGTEVVPPMRPPMRSTIPWPKRTIVVIVALVFLPPLGIGLAWWSKQRSQRTRIIASVASAVFMIAVLVSSHLDDKEKEKAKQADIDARNKKQEDQKRAEGEERQRQGEATRVADEATRAAQEKQKQADQQRLVEEKKAAFQKVKATAATLAGLQAAKPETQLVAYQEFNHAVTDAQKINADGIEPYLAAVAEIASVQKRLDELDQSEKATTPPDVADVPQKPVYEKPPYTGAFFLGGDLRGNYEGDPVVQAGSKFFVVKGAGIWMEGNYVEPTTETVTLNIGRDGREATIVTASARETYNDDQKAYAEEVKKAKSAYDEEMKTYQAAMKTKLAADAQLKQKKVESAKERRDALNERDRLLSILAAKLAQVGGDAGPR